MRTKTLLLTAALGAAGIASCMAQAVYSVNVVGYVNLSLPTQFSLIANPLNGTNNNINTILPTVPDSTTVQKWNATAQSFESAHQYYDGVGWLDADLNASGLNLNPGEAAFIFLPSASTLTFVGEVPQGTLSASVVPNFALMSQLTPQEIGLGATQFPAKDADYVLFWDAALQAYKNPITYYDGVGWLDADLNPADPTPTIGQGFFYFRQPVNGPDTWSRTFNVGP
jgi:hypothetical protein